MSIADKKPPVETADIAIPFINLARDYNWQRVTTLPADEVKILFNIVAAAGFNPTKIVLGKLVGHEREQGGGSTGETYPINTLCPYKIVDQDGNDDCPATGWLDSTLKLALGPLPRPWAKEDIIQAVQCEIERSIPLEPIQLTPEGGNFLQEIPRHREYRYPHSDNYFVDHTRDGHELSHTSSGVGVHLHCRGWMRRTRVTETHDGLVCSSCYLRVLFPREIKTYGELRKFLASTFVQVGAE